MNETKNWLVHDHRKYEATLAECELAAEAGEWKTAKRLFHGFVDDLKLHMQMEDEVLYPLFVEETGDSEGEIAELSDEHDTLARLLRDLAYVIKANDIDHLLESLVPLHEAMIEHNAHEEAAFQRMGVDSLSLRRNEIAARLNTLQNKEGRRALDF